MPSGSLAPGRYTNPAFTPRIEFELPDGWAAFHVSRNTFGGMHETDDGTFAFVFMTPDGYLTPEGEVQPGTPEEAIAALEAHEALTVSEPREVDVDGIAGLEVDVASSVENTHVMRTAEGNLGIGPGNHARFLFLPDGDEVLVFVLLAPTGQMDEALRLTEAIRRSIRIGQSHADVLRASWRRVAAERDTLGVTYDSTLRTCHSPNDPQRPFAVRLPPSRVLHSVEPRVWMWRDGLTVVGLDSRLPNRQPDHLTFDDGASGGAVEVTEAAAQAVPTVEATTGPMPVLILGGDTLLGGAGAT